MTYKRISPLNLQFFADGGEGAGTAANNARTPENQSLPC